MNFVNLAHGAFAMAARLAGSRWRACFLPRRVRFAFVSRRAWECLERLLYRRLYAASHLDQVLFSIGLTFMAVAGATWLFGPSQQPMRLPEFLRGQWSVAGVDIGIYRLFLVAVVAALAGLLGFLVARTRFGAQVRAAVDDPVAARGLGINVDRVFSVAFALGSGLAGLGGALGIEVLGLERRSAQVHGVFPARRGGGRRGHDQGPLVAALLLGVLDVAGKYYVPQAGAFVIYAADGGAADRVSAGLYGERRG